MHLVIVLPFFIELSFVVCSFGCCSACVFVCLCVWLCACVFVCSRVCSFARLFVWVRVCLFAPACVCLRVCLHVRCNVRSCAVSHVVFTSFRLVLFACAFAFCTAAVYLSVVLVEHVAC